MRDEIIVSVCDHSGRWSQPYVDLGYRVIRIDPKHGANVDQLGRGITEEPTFTGDTTTIMGDDGEGWPLTVGMAAKILSASPLILGSPVCGLLMAPPCTDFTVSGSRWWEAKDADGRTEASIKVVEDCCSLRDAVKPTLRWWVLENPVGRIARLCPCIGPSRMTFNPTDYAGLADDPEAESYNKRTVLYGEFNTDLPTDPRDPVIIERIGKSGKVYRGSPMWANLGGKSERTKELRSITPQGFSRAFATVNP